MLFRLISCGMHHVYSMHRQYTIEYHLRGCNLPGWAEYFHFPRLYISLAIQTKQYLALSLLGIYDEISIHPPHHG